MTGHDLSRLEERLAAEWKQTPIPAAIESAVMRRFDRARTRRRAATAGALAIAASIAISILPFPHHRQPSPAPVLVSNRIAAPAPQPRPVDTPAPPRRAVAAPQPAAFIAIPYAPPLEAQERATVVRMAFTLPALAAAGLPVIAAEPDTLAQADVLVGEDGQPRAIRLVSLSTK